MIAVDTNLLACAHRRESTFHRRALQPLGELAGSTSSWAIPWPCIHGFYGVVKNARAFAAASSVAQASAQVAEWMASPSLVLLQESAGHWLTLRALLSAAKIVGARVHDARIVAICLDHGVRELWSADRDFNRFPTLAVRNPWVV